MGNYNRIADVLGIGMAFDAVLVRSGADGGGVAALVDDTAGPP